MKQKNSNAVTTVEEQSCLTSCRWSYSMISKLLSRLLGTSAMTDRLKTKHCLSCEHCGFVLMPHSKGTVFLPLTRNTYVTQVLSSVDPHQNVQSCHWDSTTDIYRLYRSLYVGLLYQKVHLCSLPYLHVKGAFQNLKDTYLYTLSVQYIFVLFEKVPRQSAFEPFFYESIYTG